MQRRFLFLQGPHGPFFSALARMLAAAGAECWRVGFNAGDAAFWRDRARYIPYRGAPEDWPETFDRTVADLGITDVVLYGDTRPVHAAAAERAKARGLTLHVFEEGYLRPYWITYERGGANGNSRLMELGIDEMRAALARAGTDQPEAPARWGDMRQHMFYGALYHFFVLALNRGYPGFRPHRGIGVAGEFALHLRRLFASPLLMAERALTSARVAWSGRPYHLVLLQLAHDASLLSHGGVAGQEEFLAQVIDGFAEGAPAHHLLVFKAHPLEDGRTPLRATIRRLARARGIGARVRYVPGGKLARLLAEARSAVTVNSTAAQQALFRGLPVKCVGRAVYGKPEFVSQQTMAEFFAAPLRPDVGAYRDFRRFLLETSQVPGGFYSLRGRRAALRHVVDMMLAPEDPYDALRSGTAAPRQQLRVVAAGGG
ncbi:MAG: capsule biosynthesis protein CapA [Rhodobacteraceae bacterium]|nr:capsule biosynthesis protein CapA [Paracoccaceae bacterium]